MPAFRRLILTFQIEPEDMAKLDENVSVTGITTWLFAPRVLVPVSEYVLVTVSEYVLVTVSEYVLVTESEYVLVTVSEYVLVTESE